MDTVILFIAECFVNYVLSTVSVAIVCIQQFRY